ncbi:kinase-like protein [Mollisia scopiformis]|uniref:Kinase-like protein n=1 Tax=Mollisia scopiformis TaxID=149040 RepID=A0A194XQ47_MOLSC|nr:kinase-like protein [Mollisia scopiformis]KUJ22179.1 kinase-like protein [Mollisia scopiformis]
MSNSRTNNATEATVDKQKIFASGTFKNVWMATYTQGARSGERYVVKEFKTGSVFEAHYFEEEMNIIRRTQKIIDDFDSANVIEAGRHIRLNTPEIWTYEKSGHKALVEPMIEGFEKFNSNSGWAANIGGEWGEAMQALSHFSYHNSNRHFLLCDLQGGVYRNGYVLSDPVIMSQAQDCGPADLGQPGINSFFQRHRCGRFCNRQWVKPGVIGRAVIPMRQGTSMIAHLPTRQSHNPLSRLRE